MHLCLDSAISRRGGGRHDMAHGNAQHCTIVLMCLCQTAIDTGEQCCAVYLLYMRNYVQSPRIRMVAFAAHAGFCVNAVTRGELFYRSCRAGCGRARSMCWRQLGHWLLRSRPPSNPQTPSLLHCWVRPLCSRSVGSLKVACPHGGPVMQPEDHSCGNQC